ncbi:MAG TPA: hypothetical protein VFV79_07965 [Saprospiraceae bacterium]|nr:hypothetical protein [Saprospiraceae bacterium]
MMNKLFILLISLLAISSCKDSETFVSDPVETSLKASAFVEVVDVNGNPVPDALIAVHHNDNGSVITDTYGTTDAEGILYLKDADLFNSTYLTATKAGYFKGSRRFYPSQGKSHFVNIMLMEKQNVGSFQGGNGGLIDVQSQVTLDFPDGAIVDAAGNAYTGIVNVLAQPIAADDANLSTKMPGDLTGLNENNVRGALGSLGMVAVELVSPSGEALKIKDGQKVNLKMNVPASMLAKAPATIPMWYFDESKGYWKQEGSATLQGNQYVAEVAHFSFWNCDAWFDLVKWGATFIYENGDPATQLNVCLNIISLNASSCAQTNEDGFVCGAVAANEAMQLEVRSQCGDVLYTAQIGPYSDTTMIGPITIPGQAASLTHVQGFAVDCNGNPVTNGFASIKIGDDKYHAPIHTPNGEFGGTFVNCNNSGIDVTAFDATALKQSVTLSYPFTTNVAVGTVTVCDDLTELVDIEAVGEPQHALFYFPEVNVQGTNTQLYTLDSLNGSYFYVNVPGITEGTYVSTQSEIGFQLPNGDHARANGVTVVITYYGGVGDYIIGTVTGTFHTGPNGQGGPDYPLQGTFTVLRD